MAEQDMRPIWLLDVDGVLNAVPVKFPPPGDIWPEWRKDRVGRFKIIWAPELMRRIKAVHDSGLVEIRWCTTWREQANKHLSPLFGWPEFPVEDHVEDYRKWWKFECAKKIAEVRPIVWTDDDLDYSMREDEGAGEWHASRPNLLAITPDWTLGLTPEHMDAIEKFVGL